MKAQSCCLVSHTLQEGVGPADANRLLAAEFAKRGWQVSVCGLNDPRISSPRADAIDVYGQRVPAWHIPQAIGWRERCAALQEYLERQQPSHVIFRFIPYSLNPKGIVWAAATSLPDALRGYPTVWLMDEIWLGEGPTTLRHRLVGRLQRYSILRMLDGVKPIHIFTNNGFNTSALRRRGVNAETLRLFGNIPVVAADGGAWLYQEFEKAGIPITSANRGQWLVLGNFGLFHSDWKPDVFLGRLRELAGRQGRRVCIAGIGSLGSYEAHWRSVAGKWGDDFTFHHLGRREDFEVSHFLQSVDLGITTNPYHLVGKSGTCMAMLDHGLPLLIPRISGDDDQTEFAAGQLIRCGEQVGDEIFSVRLKRHPEPQLTRAVDVLEAAMSGALEV